MNDLAVIFQSEFIRRVRSRAFIIGTVIGAIGIIFLTVLPGVLTKSFGLNTRKIVLAGPPALLAQATPLIKKDYDIVATLPRYDATPSLPFLEAHDKAASAVLLTALPSGLHITVYARDISTTGSALADDLAPLNIALATHLPPARVNSLLTVPVELKSLDSKFADRDSASTARGVATALVFLLYLSILLNAQNIMSSVAEEKTNRIAEVLVAAVSPAQLLTAKIFATAATGLCQIIVWVGAGAAVAPLIRSQFGDASASGIGASGTPFDFGAVLSSGSVAAFVAFFLIGFVQYALLYAAAASLITRTEDLGSVVAPLVIPVVGGFLLAQFALLTPNAPNVVWLSQVPLLAPFVMFTRIAVSTVPLWQIALSLIINVAAIVVIAWAAGKVYRVGLLMYGRMPSLKQVFATLRA